MAKEEEKNGQNPETNQPPKEGFWRGAWKRFGRDLRDIGIGLVIGGAAVFAIFAARSSGTSTEEPAEDDQETDSYDEDNDSLEESDE